MLSCLRDGDWQQTWHTHLGVFERCGQGSSKRNSHNANWYLGMARACENWTRTCLQGMSVALLMFCQAQRWDHGSCWEMNVPAVLWFSVMGRGVRIRLSSLSIDIAAAQGQAYLKCCLTMSTITNHNYTTWRSRDSWRTPLATNAEHEFMEGISSPSAMSRTSKLKSQGT